MSDDRQTLVPPVRTGDHAAGADDATITLVEYGDYQCPYCGEAYPIVKRLQSELGDSLRLVFRNMPLANVHPRATDAANFAEAVALQNQFWAMHDVLYEHQDDLSEASLFGYAEEVGVEIQGVVDALESGTPQRRVRADVESAIRSGVNGTPTFFINGERYDGAWQLEPFLQHLKSIADTR